MFARNNVKACQWMVLIPIATIACGTSDLISNHTDGWSGRTTPSGLEGGPHDDWGLHTPGDELTPEDENELLACTYHDAVFANALQFVDIEAGFNTPCGVTTDGEVVCWFLPDPRAGLRGISCEPPGPFVSVVMAETHICGLRPDGEVVCWGYDADGRTSPPDVSFRTLDANGSEACGVDMDGGLHCWGTIFAWDYWSGPSFVPVGPEYRDIAVHFSGSCWLDREGRVGCFHPIPYDEIYDEPEGTFTSLAATFYGMCGMRPDRRVECWGDDQVPSPPGRFLSIDGGSNHACGIREDHTLFCWGAYDAGTGPVPEGTFAKVAAGYGLNCALDVDGYVTCWDGTETP